MLFYRRQIYLQWLVQNLCRRLHRWYMSNSVFVAPRLVSRLAGVCLKQGQVIHL